MSDVPEISIVSPKRVEAIQGFRVFDDHEQGTDDGFYKRKAPHNRVPAHYHRKEVPKGSASYEYEMLRAVDEAVGGNRIKGRGRSTYAPSAAPFACATSAAPRDKGEASDIVMEKVPGITLASFTTRDQYYFRRVCAESIFGALAQLCMLRKHVDPQFAHRDLKCDNVMLPIVAPTTTMVPLATIKVGRKDVRFLRNSIPVLIDIGMAIAPSKVNGVEAAAQLKKRSADTYALQRALQVSTDRPYCTHLARDIIPLVVNLVYKAREGRHQVVLQNLREFCQRICAADVLKYALVDWTDYTPHVVTAPVDRGTLDVLVLSECVPRCFSDTGILNVPVCLLWPRNANGESVVLKQSIVPLCHKLFVQSYMRDLGLTALPGALASKPLEPSAVVDMKTHMQTVGAHKFTQATIDAFDTLRRAVGLHTLFKIDPKSEVAIDDQSTLTQHQLSVCHALDVRVVRFNDCSYDTWFASPSAILNDPFFVVLSPPGGSRTLRSKRRRVADRYGHPMPFDTDDEDDGYGDDFGLGRCS